MHVNRSYDNKEVSLKICVLLTGFRVIFCHVSIVEPKLITDLILKLVK